MLLYVYASIVDIISGFRRRFAHTYLQICTCKRSQSPIAITMFHCGAIYKSWHCVGECELAIFTCTHILKRRLHNGARSTLGEPAADKMAATSGCRRTDIVIGSRGRPGDQTGARGAAAPRSRLRPSPPPHPTVPPASCRPVDG